MQATISSLLSMEKTLKSRLGQLNSLKDESATRTMWDDGKKTQEPVYDVRKVDKKITALNKALFIIDSSVKAANAVTQVDVKDGLDFDALMSEIE